MQWAVPAEFLSEATSAATDDLRSIEGHDRAVLEQELRRLADDTLTPELGEFLEAQALAYRNLVLAGLLDQHSSLRWRVVEHDPRTDEFVFEDAAHTAYGILKSRVGLVPMEHRLPLVRLILLLTYADRLADDDWASSAAH